MQMITDRKMSSIFSLRVLTNDPATLAKSEVIAPFIVATDQTNIPVRGDSVQQAELKTIYLWRNADFDGMTHVINSVNC